MKAKGMTRVGLVAVVIGAALELAGGAPPAGAAQGSGNPALLLAPSRVSATSPTTVTVIGGDYLVPPHATGTNVFGGVYVFFGWVRPVGAWGPSIRNSNNNDGNFGVTYSYAGDGGDASTRDDGRGIVRLVSFTPGGSSGASTPFHMDDNGNWRTTLKIPGPTYVWTNPITGATTTVDCRTVQCGVYTIGAHGKASATNERFAPVTFAAPATPTTGTPLTNPPATNPPLVWNGDGAGSDPTTASGAGSGSGNATPTTAGTARAGNGGPSTNGATAVTSTTTPRKAKPRATGKRPKTTTTVEATARAAGDKTASAALEPISTSSNSSAPVGLIVVGLLALGGLATGTTLLVRRLRRAPAG